MTSRALAASLALLASACASRLDPRLVREPIARRTWLSPLHRDHPLVGKIWEPRATRFVDEATLGAAIAASDYLLLGETHDNADHHVLQARLLRSETAAGRRPALAFEMLERDQQPKIDAALAASPKDPDAIAKAVAWDRSGWPEFRFYRPIFEAGLEAGLPVVAANLPRGVAKDVVKKGAGALDPETRARIEREPPTPEPVLAALKKEMEESHCGELPPAMLQPLVLAQRARDAGMEQRMLAAGAERGAVLITGKGHARTDRGIPALLAVDAPGKRIVSVAFLEVDPEAREPQGYAEEWGGGAIPFDYVVFTPGAEREDPCEDMRAHMQKKAKAAEPTKPADAAEPAPPAPAPAAP